MSNEWVIDVPAEAVRELEASFNDGPIIDDSGRRLFLEEQVARYNGLKIEIFSNEHPPPHFRVKAGGETANYTIKDCTKLNGGLDKWYHTIKKWHADNKHLLIETWNRKRPSDCPVGLYYEGA